MSTRSSQSSSSVFEGKSMFIRGLLGLRFSRMEAAARQSLCLGKGTSPVQVFKMVKEKEKISLDGVVRNLSSAAVDNSGARNRRRPPSRIVV
jgi:hypothetical protein